MYIRLQKTKIREKDFANGRVWIGPKQSAKSLPNYYPISLESILQIYRIKRSKASRLRIEASNTKWINMHEQYEPIEINKKPIPISHINQIRKFSIDYPIKRIVIWNGLVCIQMPNMIKSNIVCVKRKPIDKSGNIL